MAGFSAGYLDGPVHQGEVSACQTQGYSVIVQGKGHRPPSLRGAKEHAGKFFGVVVVSGGVRTQGLIYPRAVRELTMKPKMPLSF